VIEFWFDHKDNKKLSLLYYIGIVILVLFNPISEKFISYLFISSEGPDQAIQCQSHAKDCSDGNIYMNKQRRENEIHSKTYIEEYHEYSENNLDPME